MGSALRKLWTRKRRGDGASPTCQTHVSRPKTTVGMAETCWAVFHDAIINGRFETCEEILTPIDCCAKSPSAKAPPSSSLTSSLCPTPGNMAACLGALPPNERLHHLDAIAFRKLRTTSLHMAALYRRPRLVKLLLQHGADPLAADGFGRTAGAVLLEHWPRVQFPAHRDDSQATGPPSHREHVSETALQQGQREVELFKAKVMTWRVRSAEALHHLLHHCADLNHIADRRRAAALLHIAARHDLAEVIEILIKVGQEREKNKSECEDKGGDREDCPRTSASPKGWGKPETQLTEVRARQREHPERGNASSGETSETDRKGGIRRRGESRASRDGQVDDAQRSFPPPEADKDGGSCASERRQAGGSLGTARRAACDTGPSMKAAGRGAVDLEVRNGTLKTPLAVAADRGAIKAVVCLIQHGACCAPVDFYGRSILHFMCERNMTFDPVLCDVLSRGADVNRADNGGNTPLHTAAFMGSVWKIQLLLDKGASLQRTNLAGKSPLFLAFNRKDPAAREAILLLMMSTVEMRLRDKFQRLPLLLQQPENQSCLRQLDDMARSSCTLLRCAVVGVRRVVGFGNLLGLTHPSQLRCPYFVQLAVFGQDERAIASALFL